MVLCSIILFILLLMDIRIADIRKHHGLMQSQLAEYCDTSIQMIQYLEYGQRKLTTEWMERLAEGFAKAGFENVEPWHFVIDPEEIAHMQNDPENLLGRFEALSEEGREAVLKTLETEEFKTIRGFAEPDRSAQMSYALHEKEAKAFEHKPESFKKQGKGHGKKSEKKPGGSKT